MNRWDKLGYNNRRSINRKGEHNLVAWHRSPKACQESPGCMLRSFVRLILDDVVQFFIKLEAIHVHSVEPLARDVDELHRRRALGAGQLIYLCELLGVLYGQLGAVVLDKSAPEDKVAIGT